MTEKLIFEHSRPDRQAAAQFPHAAPAIDDLPAGATRTTDLGLPLSSGD